MSRDLNIDPSLAAELRAVPLPDGLLGRLRAAALADDAGLDAALRHVPLPPGLSARLRWAAAVDDDGLDAALCDVPVPARLCRDLRRAVLANDAGLDAVLCDVPMSRRAVVRLRRIPEGPIPVGRIARWATAASLLVAVGATFLGAVLSFLFAISPAANRPVAGRPPLTIDASAAGVREDELGMTPLEMALAVPRTQERAEAAPASVADIALERPDAYAPRWSQLADLWGQFERHGRMDPFLDVRPYQWPDDVTVVGASREYDLLPELKKVPPPQPQGVPPPLVPGFDLRHYIRYRMFPFVMPAMHARLQTSVVPLGVDAASYELTRRYLEDGQLPPAEAIRTEEFLAAIDYQYPAPTRQPLGVTVAAGPSPFGGEGLTLLQIGVQARQLREEKLAPVHLVLAVDVSASMRQGGRLDMLPRAADRLLRRLGPDDRVSLVAFSERSRVVLEDAGREDADEVRRAVAGLQAETSTNIPAALRRAYTVARQHAEPGKRETLVVLLTDGTADVDPAAAELIEKRLVEARPRDIRLEVIDLGYAPQAGQQLARFAAAGGGAVRRAANADQVCWALAEAMTGNSQMVAADVRLRVTFDPKTVLEYRLLGHEPNALAGMSPPQTEADFFAGQSATALYEVRLAPKGTDIATIELSWNPSEGGQRREITRKVVRKDFVPLFVQAPASLQAAALAAQTAEVLRKHPRTLRTPRPLTAVLELAKQVRTELYDRPSFVEFLAVVERAEKARK